MSALTDIYDFFTPLEEAAASVFDKSGVTCYTPLGEQQLDQQAQSDPTLEQSFQKKRPRVELALSLGASKGILRAQSGRRPAAGHLREKARTCTLHVNVVTDPDIVKHRAFVSTVLYIADTLAYEINETGSLTNHFVQRVSCTGESGRAYNAEDGQFETHLAFEIDLSVQEYAWDALDAAIADPNSGVTPGPHTKTDLTPIPHILPGNNDQQNQV